MGIRNVPSPTHGVAHPDVPGLDLGLVLDVERSAEIDAFVERVRDLLQRIVDVVRVVSTDVAILSKEHWVGRATEGIYGLV